MGPTRYEVRNVPQTGAVKPFETWATWADGRRKHIASFKTEEAARKAQAKFVALAAKFGETVETN